VITTVAALALAAIVATQLGYTQRLFDAARYRIQLIGVPDLTETTIASQPAALLTTANWEKIPLPAPASQITDFSADPSDPQRLLVCGLSSLDTPIIHGEITPRGPVAIWGTRDAGKTWSRSQWPPITGTFCWMNRAPDAPQQLILLIEHPSPIEPRCSEYDMLLSDDNGVTWRPTPTTYIPTDEAVYYCSHNAFIFGRRLLLYTNWSTGQTTQDLHTVVARSDDGGLHWTEFSDDAARFLNSGAAFLADGMILSTRWPPQQEEPQDTVLRASTDKGDSWRPFRMLHGIVGEHIMTSLGANSASASADHPLYLMYAEHIPSLMLLLKVAQVVDDRHWAYLPPLPVKGASAEHIGVTSLLGVTASGKLLAFGVNPQSGVPAGSLSEGPISEQWLWSWDPRAARWTSLAPPLPVAWKACSDGCWQAFISQSASSQESVLWVRGFVSENGANELYPLTLPAEVA
jgi:hypothetical protein